MSSGSLPPLPALIPIAALLKCPPSNNNSGVEEGGHRDCAPCANHSKVMGEQRSRRPGRQPPVDLIDNARSRGTSAAPQARKIRPERHRKSDRRRDRRRRGKTQLEIEKHKIDDTNQSPERPINPRVNPIFVWVRQEDTRIVEVKCEDYDKRNRILLTKTPQGWRATPRTETLVPSQKEEADKKHHHHHHHRNKKSKKHKTRQKSTSVQVDDLSDENPEASEDIPQPEVQESYPSWESPVNVESLLPSHTIHVPRKSSPRSEQSPPNSPSVNSGVNESAQIQHKCSDKICDVSPLDNLLAVAELEFNEQIKSGEWDKNPHTDQIHNNDTPTPDDQEENISENQKIFMEDMEHLKNLIESCTQDDDGKLTAGEEFLSMQPKEECDYTEDEENNLAMDDILSRLEQSLRSPESPELTLALNVQQNLEDIKVDSSSHEEEKNYEQLDCFTENHLESDNVDEINTSESIIETIELIEEAHSEEPSDKLEEPTDLSLKPKVDLTIEITSKNDEPEQPTDLSIPRNSKLSPLTPLTLRPSSQSSDALQSPQPSGIPAVPPSPDLVSPSTVNSTNTKSKSTFLETLLASTSPKMALNSEVTIERQKEPLDLGACRKSASPTVSCSEEVKNQVDGEPPPKKLKTSQPITLKNLLDNVLESKKMEEKSQETPKLIELLNTDASQNPLTQLRQVLSDKTLVVPDPMLVPKEKLSKIIANPGKEIPELLRSRPELRLPEALAYPHLLQDPDILVITVEQLETIVKKQNPNTNKLPTLNKNDNLEKLSEKQVTKKCEKDSKSRGGNKIEEPVKTGHTSREYERKNDQADIDMATNAALNQMFWLPYMNQVDALQFANNSDFMKMLANSNMPATFPNQMSELSHFLSSNRFPGVPPNLPMPTMNYNNSLEMQMWQEAMMQSSLMGPKNASGGLEMRNSFKDFMEKMSYNNMSKSYMQNQKFHMQNKQSLPNQFFQGAPTMPNPYINIPQTYQGGNIRSNLQMPTQFNAMFPQKNMPMNLPKQHSKADPKVHMANSYQHDKSSAYSRHSDQYGTIRTKPAYKLMNNISSHHKNGTHEQYHHSKEKNSDGPPRQHTSQPIDLSGATTTTSGRLKVKHQQQLVDSLGHRKLLRHDDIPEVGSTTASIEEMQEAHKHLWHPLFGK
ncbi:hypothetical protein HHI36_018121 [Cryptolaemus montrouzieri]|uniref:Uncharacterized protein n=1 Tax=Cryptolaemus montrouzieri TaxID=559131 RepID=A0ABD2NZB2_9CUCU